MLALARQLPVAASSGQVLTVNYQPPLGGGWAEGAQRSVSRATTRARQSIRCATSAQAVAIEVTLGSGCLVPYLSVAGNMQVRKIDAVLPMVVEGPDGTVIRAVGETPDHTAAGAAIAAVRFFSLLLAPVTRLIT